MKEWTMIKMSSFDIAIKKLLEDEGGYVNDPVDPGGETKFGISKRTYPDVDIKNLTVDGAKAIYKRDFWDKGGYDNIDDTAVADKVFNLAVNMGARRAHKLIQRAMMSVGVELVEDGILGPKSFSAINSVDNNALLAAYRSEAAGYYRVLIARRKKFLKYKNGWLKRAYS